MVVVGMLLALLAIGGRRDEDPTPVEAEFSPAPAPTQVESGSGVPVPALEPVPLAISETTPPPGWDPPDTAEEQLALALADFAGAALYQVGMALVAVAVVLGLMFYVEHRRHG